MMFRVQSVGKVILKKARVKLTAEDRPPVEQVSGREGRGGFAALLFILSRYLYLYGKYGDRDVSLSALTAISVCDRVEI